MAAYPNYGGKFVNRNRSYDIIRCSIQGPIFDTQRSSHNEIVGRSLLGIDSEWLVHGQMESYSCIPIGTSGRLFSLKNDYPFGTFFITSRIVDETDDDPLAPRLHHYNIRSRKDDASAPVPCSCVPQLPAEFDWLRPEILGWEQTIQSDPSAMGPYSDWCDEHGWVERADRLRELMAWEARMEGCKP